MPKRVCIVDDSLTARQSLKARLEKGGYEIIEASNGIDAKSKLSNTEVDLLITDFEMPAMNGLELAKNVRQMVGKSFLPILIMSSRRDDNLKNDARSLGVAGWMDKAADMARLPKMVNLLIGA